MQTQHIKVIYSKQDLAVVLVSTSDSYADLFKSDSVKTFYGNIHPAWIVIRKLDDVFALNMQSEQFPINKVFEAVPELKAFLEQELVALSGVT